MYESEPSQRLVKPGYHLRPRFDLHGLRNRRNQAAGSHLVGELPLTSLIDMFSILVIYLLMNFSATGEIFFLNKNLLLPKAFSTHPLANAPLISIVKGRGAVGFQLDAPEEYQLTSTLTDDSLDLKAFTAELSRLKQVAETDPQLAPLGITRVNLQADEETPIEAVKRAMQAAFQAGWAGINFVVQKDK